MLIYNVTTKLDHSIADAWVSWLKEEHIPDLVATGCFTHAVILRVSETDESDGPTYAVQYYAETKEMYNRYIEEYSDEMRKRSTKKWGNKFISFRTVMQVVD